MSGHRIINDFNDPSLTRTGGMPFAAWCAELRRQIVAHGSPIPADITPEDWRCYYDDDETPHGALEEDFNNG